MTQAMRTPAHASSIARPVVLERTKKAPALKCRQRQRSEGERSCAHTRRTPSWLIIMCRPRSATHGRAYPCTPRAATERVHAFAMMLFGDPSLSRGRGFLRNMPIIGNVLSLPAVRAVTDRLVSKSRLPV